MKLLFVVALISLTVPVFGFAEISKPQKKSSIKSTNWNLVRLRQAAENFNESNETFGKMPDKFVRLALNEPAIREQMGFSPDAALAIEAILKRDEVERALLTNLAQQMAKDTSTSTSLQALLDRKQKAALDGLRFQLLGLAGLIVIPEGLSKFESLEPQEDWRRNLIEPAKKALEKMRLENEANFTQLESNARVLSKIWDLLARGDDAAAAYLAKFDGFQDPSFYPLALAVANSEYDQKNFWPEGKVSQAKRESFVKALQPLAADLAQAALLTEDLSIQQLNAQMAEWVRLLDSDVRRQLNALRIKLSGNIKFNLRMVGTPQSK